MLLLFSGPAVAADAACAERTSTAELRSLVERTSQALRDLDDDRFRDEFNELAGLALPCAADLVAPDLAVRYHELMGIHLFALGDVEEAELAVVAARRLDGEAPIPADLLAEDHDLRRAWSADAGVPRFRKVAEPRSGSLAFDGTAGRSRPKGVPTVLQRFDDSGLLVSTDYLGARDPMPAYDAVPRRRTALVVGASASGALSVAAFALAVSTHERLYATAADQEVPASDLDQLRATTNAWTAAGSATLLGALGAGTAALVVGDR